MNTDRFKITVELPEEEKLRELIAKHNELMNQLWKNLNDIGSVRMQLECKISGKNEGLAEFATCELVEELRHREGVEAKWAEVEKDTTFTVNGPAMALIAID